MNPEIILHRRNTIRDLETVPREFGVEIDIRSDRGVLHLEHVPFVSGDPFEAWLQHYRHGTLVLNVKEAGLEEAVLRLLRDASVDRFFFLDQPFPGLVTAALGGERRVAIRSSEFESVAACDGLTRLVDWVWIDSFQKLRLNERDVNAIRDAGLKVCLVSPELQGRRCDEEALPMASYLLELGLSIDAVCTKDPEVWTAVFHLLAAQTDS